MSRAFVIAAIAAFAAAGPNAAAAHQLVVFAAVDCASVKVEAKFSNGRIAQEGEVRVLDAENALLTTLPLESDGTAVVALDSVDHEGGLVIEVEAGHHDNYWIVTPEDIARHCGS